MKLFIWRHVASLASGGYTGGAFAFAEDVKQAKSFIKIRLIQDSVANSSIGFIMNDLATHVPQVIEEPEGFAVWGSPL